MTFAIYDTPVRPGVQGKGITILAATWPQIFLCLIVLGLRSYYAGTTKGQPRWDCIWAVFASMIGIAAQVALTLGTIEGLGQHILDLSGFHQASFALKWYWISAMLCIFAISFAKISIVSLLLSVWCPWQTKRRYFLHFIWSSNLILTIAQVAISMNQCRPIAQAFDYSMTTADCSLRITALRLGYFTGAWNACTDVVLALYPVLIMRDIKADLKTKIGFCALMSGGFISCIASILRTVYIHKISLSFDTTYEIVDTSICGGTELWLIILLGSIPPLKHQLIRVLRRYGGSQFGQSIPSDSTAATGGTGGVRAKSEPQHPDEMDLNDIGNLTTEPDLEGEARLEMGEADQHATKKGWMGGILMRNSVWVTGKPITRPQTRDANV